MDEFMIEYDVLTRPSPLAKQHPAQCCGHIREQGIFIEHILFVCRSLDVASPRSHHPLKRTFAPPLPVPQPRASKTRHCTVNPWPPIFSHISLPLLILPLSNRVRTMTSHSSASALNNLPPERIPSPVTHLHIHYGDIMLQLSLVSVLYSVRSMLHLSNAVLSDT